MKSLQTLTKKSTGIKKSLRLNRGGTKKKGEHMKDNKITRKKYRLEVLERTINIVYGTLEEYEDSLKYSKEQLAEELDKPEDEQNTWRIDNSRDNINEYSIRIEEAKKLIADFEKMV